MLMTGEIIPFIKVVILLNLEKLYGFGKRFKALNMKRGLDFYNSLLALQKYLLKDLKLFMAVMVLKNFVSNVLIYRVCQELIHVSIDWIYHHIIVTKSYYIN